MSTKGAPFRQLYSARGWSSTVSTVPLLPLRIELVQVLLELGLFGSAGEGHVEPVVARHLLAVALPREGDAQRAIDAGEDGIGRLQRQPLLVEEDRAGRVRRRTVQLEVAVV